MSVMSAQWCSSSIKALVLSFSVSANIISKILIIHNIKDMHIIPGMRSRYVKVTYFLFSLVAQTVESKSCSGSTAQPQAKRQERPWSTFVRHTAPRDDLNRRFASFV
jgi:hypothetical protein